MNPSRRRVVVSAVLSATFCIALQYPFCAARANGIAPGSKLNFESAHLDPIGHNLTENGREYNGVEKPDGKNHPAEYETLRVWRSPSVSYGPEGGVSMAYETLPIYERETKTQKIMHELLALRNPGFSDRRDSEDFFPMGEKRYVGFAFRVAEDARYSEVPVAGKPAMVFQLWQGTPFSPIVDASLKSDGTANGLELQFSVRNHKTDDPPICVSVGSDGIVATETPIVRGHWYKFIVMIIPRHAPEIGELKVWVADVGKYSAGQDNASVDWAGPSYKQIVDFDIEPIGYSELDAFCHTETEPCPREEDDTDTTELPPCPQYPLPGGLIEIGIYRNYQPRRMKVFFDKVRITTTFSAAKLEAW